MRALSFFAVLLALLLAACSGSFDRKAAKREAMNMYDERIGKTTDVFYEIQIYDVLPPGFEKTSAADGDVGCQYYRRPEDGKVFDYVDVCANERQEVVIIRVVKEFTEKGPIDAFYERVKGELDQKYYSQSRSYDAMDATLWKFKNRSEWIDSYVKHAQEEFKYGKYAQVHRRPTLLEIHDKLRSIRLAKESNAQMNGRRDLSFVDAVSVTYTSRLADILKKRKNDADYQRANETLKDL